MHTTIQIRKDTAEKLQKIKGNLSYDALVNQLMDENDVFGIKDLEKISRSKIAFRLEFYSYDVDESAFFDVTFFDLKDSVVGSEFKAPSVSNNGFYLEQSARIVFKDDDCVVVKIKTVDHLDTGVFQNIDVVCVEFF